MFNFPLPKWNKKISIKVLSIVFTAIYVITVIPLLILGHYNWPSADDLSLALKTYQYYQATGNIIGTFLCAFKVGFDEYMNWMGYFFSNVMFCYSPNIFGERWYALVGYEMLFILSFGVCYFCKSLFVYALKADKYLSNIISMLMLIIIVQSMPQGMTRVEAFYWYSGAVNYMFMFGMGLFWLGLLIRSVYLSEKKKRIRKLVWAGFWGFWLGGANYMTALEMAICSVLVLVIFLLSRPKIRFITLEGMDAEQKKSFGFIWIPAVLNLIGFMLSCLAPGNSTREALVTGFGPVKSILIALYYVFDICINNYTRWEVIVGFVLVIPVAWKMAAGIKHRFEHPFIFCTFAYGMVAANMVPPLYALANLEAGRLQSIIWAEYVLMTVLSVFYVTAWVRQSFYIKDENDEKLFSEKESFSIVICILFVMFGSVLSSYTDHHYYTCTSAASDLLCGYAKIYLNENEERLALLKKENETDIVFEPYSVRPRMLVFDDVTEDTEYWINRVYARYYGKNTIVLRKGE